MNPTYIITVNLSQVSGAIAVTGISSTLTSVISTAILAGSAATIAVGTTTTLAAGSSATVTNVGTSGAATFNFGIPKGVDSAGDMLKATYDPANVNTQLAADSAVVHKAGDSMSGALSVAVTSGATTPITATVDSSTASQPAFLAKNNTNYAHGSNIIKAQMLNASDTGAVVRIENAGTGKNISSANGTTETFSVDKTGAILSAGIAVPTISSTSVITNKDLTSGTNTFPTLNQNTTGTASNVTGTVAVTNGGTGSTTKNFIDLTTAQTVAGVKTFSSTITSNVATGTSPLTVTSTTKVTNLNADQVDGFNASSTPTASTILPLDSNASLASYQQAWQPVTFQNSWVDFGGTAQTCAYMKDSMGFVHLKGLMKNGTVGSIAFTLPAGYRPLAFARYGTIGNGGFAAVDLDASGNFTAYSTNVSFSLDGITFRAEN